MVSNVGLGTSSRYLDLVAHALITIDLRVTYAHSWSEAAIADVTYLPNTDEGEKCANHGTSCPASESDIRVLIIYSSWNNASKFWRRRRPWRVKVHCLEKSKYCMTTFFEKVLDRFVDVSHLPNGVENFKHDESSLQRSICSRKTLLPLIAGHIAKERMLRSSIPWPQRRIRWSDKRASDIP
ncbi:predicted protein [Histoplasma capsulatum H143]|uniref:Uncharacterized protein n=1 Tax=Ajellomyces capsulatus (strain H143) TaxID=544712 RepID=C6H368_AJECH|nr:predicted protein [Histoplasma capsulatum H143]